jgi:hypothetical protein
MEDFQKEIDDQAAQKAQDQKELALQAQAVERTNALINAVTSATKALMAFQAQHQPKVSVTNQKDFPTSISTPDVQEVVKALENLKQPILENKIDHTPVVEALSKLNESISKLPTSFPEAPEPVEEVTVKNLIDYSKEFQSLGIAIKGIDVKPVVNIPEDKPDDYSPIIDSLTKVMDAIKAIEIPKVPKTDLTPLVDATQAVQDTINNLKFPVPNYILPYADTKGVATQAPVPILSKAYDEIDWSNPDGNGNYQTITTKSGGVAKQSLSLTFDGSNNVTSIVRN